MLSLFRRHSSEPTSGAPGASEVDASAQTARTATKAHTASKRERGVATPKRQVAEGRRVEAPPANRREAAKRMRAKQRAAGEEERLGIIAGDERYLLKRDQGPERALVRDIVDSRRNAAAFLIAAAVVVLASGFTKNLTVLTVANAAWLLISGLVIADSVYLCWRVRSMVRKRFPETEQKIYRLCMYAVMRAVGFRRTRIPKPRVSIGAKV